MKTINDIIQLLRSYDPYKTDEQLVEFLSELISDHYAKINLNNDEIVFPWNPGYTHSVEELESASIAGLSKIEDMLCAATSIPKARLFPTESKVGDSPEQELYESLQDGICKDIVGDLITHRAKIKKCTVKQRNDKRMIDKFLT